MKPNILITGGTGFLGQVLARHFTTNGHQVTILTRSPTPSQGNLNYQTWDAKTIGPWIQDLEKADVLINMNGRSVDCRYTAKNKALIYSSRLEATKVLGEAIAGCQNPPQLWINSSTATIYRHEEERPNDEATGIIGEGFSVDVAKKWEATFFAVPTPNTRKIALRTAIVLGKEGGALPALVNLVKMGLGGKQGNGQQKVSWLHAADFADIIDFLIQQKEAQGIYNACAPNPTDNATLMHLLCQKLGAKLVQLQDLNVG